MLTQELHQVARVRGRTRPHRRTRPHGWTRPQEQQHALILKQMKNQEKEAYRQEQRWRSIQFQLNQLQDKREEDRREADRRRRVEQSRQEEVASGSQWSPEGEPPNSNIDLHVTAPPRGWSRATIPRFEDGDDVEQYLTTFERLATAYRWPKEQWAVYLVPHLSGKARSAYVAMDINESMDYDNVKEAILAKYEMNEEMYRQRFREPDVRPGETPRELCNRLKDLYKKWVKPAEKTVEEIGEMLILEQYLCTLTPEVKVWVKEQNWWRPSSLLDGGPRSSDMTRATASPPLRVSLLGLVGVFLLVVKVVEL